jgi:lipoate---protein ligase
MTGASFRVIDTGVRGGRANIAFDQALIEARKEGRIPNTVRFLRFRPSALLGRHQLLSQEIRVDYCARHGIEIGRRITGGGGLYLDEGQIGWELLFDRASLGVADLNDAARRICEAAAKGLERLGIAARYRPRNDIEVDGRKLSGTGGFFDGDLLFYQGTLLIDFDPVRMLEVLNVPAAKLEKRGLATAGQRIVTLRELLGSETPGLPSIYEALLAGFAERLDIAAHWDEATPAEEALAARLYRDEIGTDAFVGEPDAPPAGDDLATASLTRPGGNLRVDIRLEGVHRNRIREVLITGDFFVTPPRVVLDLEAALRGIEIESAGQAIDTFFSATRAQMLSLSAGDFRDAVEAALRQRRQQET